jgi:hypothetical protein
MIIQFFQFLPRTRPLIAATGTDTSKELGVVRSTISCVGQSYCSLTYACEVKVMWLQRTLKFLQSYVHVRTLSVSKGTHIQRLQHQEVSRCTLLSREALVSWLSGRIQYPAAGPSSAAVPHSIIMQSPQLFEICTYRYQHRSNY